ncbi:MAG: CheR family methyltransferase [Cytophagaceae bacterium]
MIAEEKLIEEFLNEIFLKYGYDFREYSTASITRRIKRFKELRSGKNWIEFQDQVLTDEKYFGEFLREVTVNVTEMFRDPSFYKALREQVIPQLKTYPFIRIWDAGCSTGEETYSLAILLYEEGLYDKCQIYATDINQQVVKKAKEGVFTLQQIKEFTSNYHASGGKEEFSNYFTAKYNNVVMHDFLKKNMVFSAHNLVSDGSFNEFHLIICRNVLIYFKRELQDRVIKLFYESLPAFGFLGLGNKETLSVSDYRNKFIEIDKIEKIYKRSG